MRLRRGFRWCTSAWSGVGGLGGRLGCLVGRLGLGGLLGRGGLLRRGVLDGKSLSAEEINKLADLESREVLLSKLAGAMNATLAKAVYLFAAPLSQAARTVDALRAKVEAEGPVSAAPAEAPADETPADAPAAEATADVATGGDSE